MNQNPETTEQSNPSIQNTFNLEVDAQSNQGGIYSTSEFDFDNQHYIMEIRLPNNIDGKYALMQTLQKLQRNPETQATSMKFIGRCVSVTDDSGLMIIGMNNDGLFVYDNQRLNLALLIKINATILLMLTR